MHNQAYQHEDGDEGRGSFSKLTYAINIHRDVMQSRVSRPTRLHSTSPDPSKQSPRCQWLRHQFVPKSPWSALVSLLPILSWLPQYSLKKDLLPDVIAGVTVFALNVPQGLSYAKLAGADPINGIYLSIFPVAIYFMLGTSRHVSIGTFAVISIACKEAVNKFDYTPVTSANLTKPGDDSVSHPLAPIDVLTSLCLLVGIIQLLLGVLRLGVVGILLSDTLVSAFVVGSACHVFTSQVLSLLGLSTDTRDIESILAHVPFELVRTYVGVVLRVKQINLATVLISAVTISTLLAVKLGVEPYLMRKFRLKSLSLPIDIVMIVIVTAVSHLLNLNKVYNVKIIPKIPTAFEHLPKAPQLTLWPRLAPDAFIVAFVAYVTTFSLGKIFAKKHGYQVSSNQELIALGSANIFSSFFLCYPCSGSLGRSVVQERVGGHTQVTSIVSMSIIIVFLLFLSRYLATLPQCVLASIIVVALLSTLKKMSDFWSIWKTSKVDGLSWLCTFLFVLLLGVGNGLIAGLALSLFLLLVQLAYPTMRLKHRLPETEVYVDEESNHNNNNLMVVEKAKTAVVVFDFQGPLIFINTGLFQSKFHGPIMDKVNLALDYCRAHYTAGQVGVIFDCSSLTYIDRKGVETLAELNGELAQLDHFNRVELVLSNLNHTCLAMLEHCRFFDTFPLDRCFLTTHDAFAFLTTTTTTDRTIL